MVESQHKEPDVERRLEIALDARKFEIELSWRRAAYFWTLLAGAFAGFFAVGDDSPERSLLIAGIAMVISLGWYLVNRGSKEWQENWEISVDKIGKDIIGDVFTKQFRKKDSNFFDFRGPYPYSPSKINIILSLFITLVWAILVFDSILMLDSILDCDSLILIFDSIKILGSDSIFLILWLSVSMVYILLRCGKRTNPNAEVVEQQLLLLPR